MHMFAKRRKLTSAEEKEINDSVVDFICMDMRPFAVVEGDGFKWMMNKASRGSYTVTAHSTYHGMTTIAYRKALRTLKALLSGIIKTDMWTSI